MIYDNIDKEKINDVQQRVENCSLDINNIVTEIIKPYCKDLDWYVNFIMDVLKDSENPPTDIELDDFCMNLGAYIYVAGAMCEQLGIKDDIAKSIYKEIYNNHRNDSKGTIADKNALAELASQHEQLVSICYTRAYKIMKSKVENAQELLSACKKILTRRMNEMQLTRIGG